MIIEGDNIVLFLLCFVNVIALHTYLLRRYGTTTNR
jgi:hypothetical protein